MRAGTPHDPADRAGREAARFRYPNVNMPPRPRRYAKNPLRQHVSSLSLAIVEANKLDEFIDADALKWIRDGITASRILADELGRLADRLGAEP